MTTSAAGWPSRLLDARAADAARRGIVGLAATHKDAELARLDEDCAVVGATGELFPLECKAHVSVLVDLLHYFNRAQSKRTDRLSTPVK